jgi:DNA mismatch endonuclease, patch repair protein
VVRRLDVRSCLPVDRRAVTADHPAEPPRASISIGSGQRVPYPVATDQAATAIGRANRRSDTKPEIALRSELHRRGWRFRVDFPVRTRRRIVRPDIVFTRRRTAVFIDGCFWHCCPDHGTVPKSNADYWAPKLRRNVERDRETDQLLEAAGWTIVRVWEHEEWASAADRVEAVLRRAFD